jgi:hypothetical protein
MVQFLMKAKFRQFALLAVLLMMGGCISTTESVFS